jgi:hypothetical protein
MSELEKFQDWFAARCDGDWEHSSGIKITTLDNPGWSLEVRLHDTCMEGHTLEWVKIDRSEEDWLHCWTEDGKFQARGGARNLAEMLGFFVDWSNRCSAKK